MNLYGTVLETFHQTIERTYVRIYVRICVENILGKNTYVNIRTLSRINRIRTYVRTYVHDTTPLERYIFPMILFMSTDRTNSNDQAAIYMEFKLY